MREATKLIEAGKVVPFVNPRSFTFETADEAHRAVEDRTAAGKIVIEIPG
jgi:NADPH2:quinone reductase